MIQKFRIDKAAGETQMPVLSDRHDVIVITDEAHRSQYDTLALNMRNALPNAAFMGFTGTPLLAGEELTRREFGDYVSIYNFRDAIEDGATVPLYYENRIPELQLINEDFADELTELLEDAELDEDAEGRLVRRFGREYALITRPERLRTVARDLVRHFVGRGFAGKAMYVGIDKAAAVRMYDLVQEEWAEHLAELRTQHDALPELERPWLASRIELMETTDMAVVVSQGQNEIKTLADKGLDIRPHRARMNAEDLDEDFKDPTNPLRLVFVCAMWMVGFDAPSVSTIYLDRPMRNHTLMQTIARANRVFPDKDNGLIVDYIGVFRDLERALAIYGAANAEAGVDSPIQDKSELLAALAQSVDAVAEFCGRYDVDLDELRTASGFTFIALRDAAVEALLVDEEVRTEFLGCRCSGPEALQGHPSRPDGCRLPGARGGYPGARRTDRRRVQGAAGRPHGGGRCCRRSARPLRGRRGVRDPGGRRGHRAGSAHRPVADRLRCPRRPVRRSQAGRDRPAGLAAEGASGECRDPQPDPLRPSRADRGADRRLQRRQPQHRRVPPSPDRSVPRSQRRGTASGRRGHDRGGAGDLRPAHQARPRSSTTPNGSG